MSSAHIREEELLAEIRRMEEVQLDASYILKIIVLSLRKLHLLRRMLHKWLQ